MQDKMKAVVAAVVPLAAFAIMWATTQQFDQEELITLLSALVSAIVVYITPNVPKDADRDLTSRRRDGV